MHESEQLRNAAFRKKDDNAELGAKIPPRVVIEGSG